MQSLSRVCRYLDQFRPYKVLDRPIFLLSAPRSGSTYLFDLLCQFEDIWSWHVEADEIWWRHFPYDRLAEPSDLVKAEECQPGVLRSLRRELYRHALWGRQQRGQRWNWKDRLGLGPVRYLEKTTANCFHIEFLKRAFPDATYVFLVRDGRATISSMMEGWQDPIRFAKPQLRPYFKKGEGALSHWAYSVPPGWQTVQHCSLEEVCAWSWRQHVQTVVRQLEDIPPSRKIVVKYEQLKATPLEIARQLATVCQLAWREEVTEFCKNQPLSRTTVSVPRDCKWRALHGDGIERILPAISGLMAELGYGDAVRER
jgi:hypothetical protein